MPTAARLYDLMLLLSTSAPDDVRAKIRADVEASIAAGSGAIERNDDWGTRPLTYQINHQAEAEYHLLQFTGPASLLETLSHSLKITDGVLRFRIIKLANGVGAPPDLKSAPAITPVADEYEALAAPSYDPDAATVERFEAESDAVAIDEAPAEAAPEAEVAPAEAPEPDSVVEPEPDAA